MFGLRLEGSLPVEEEFFLWPENEPVWDLWLWVQTQWRSDGGTRTGLDYQGVQIAINNRPIPKKDKPGYFRALQAMECAALDEWFNQR
jgi:hypothetical protein